MKIYKFLLVVFALLSLVMLAGCGGSSKTTKDDSDKSDTMKDVYDGFYYVTQHLKSIRPLTDEEKETIDADYEYTYLNTKYLTHEKDMILGGRPAYAVMELSQEESTVYVEEKNKGEGYMFFAVFEDGTVSLVETDKNLLDESVTQAEILSEDILCSKKLKVGDSWVSPDGKYSHIDRYEYVVLDNFRRTAPSFKISTYSDETMTDKIRVVWWCPAIGWFVQWQDWDEGTVDLLTEINFDWEEDE